MIIVAVLLGLGSGVLLSVATRRAGTVGALASAVTVVSGAYLANEAAGTSWAGLLVVLVTFAVSFLANGWTYRDSPALAGHGYWARVGMVLTARGRVDDLEQHIDRHDRQDATTS